MHVPYGFGVGDFVAVGTLAWNVYKSCRFEPYLAASLPKYNSNRSVGKAAPGSFDSISVEVLSLHAVLKECEETVFSRSISPERKERLVAIKEGCDMVLRDLQSLVVKYESLGTQSKRTWDRMKWGNEDIAEIRARITSNISLLTAYITTSQQCVEAKFDKFIQEFRQGKREESIVSLQTIDSLSADDRTLWRSIRKELEGIGIDLAAFEANRSFILDWLARAIETGAFDERNTDNIVEDNSCSDEQEPCSSEEYDNRSNGPQITQSNTESLDEVSENHSPMLKMSPQSAHGVEKNTPKPAKTFDHIIASRKQVSRAPVPRVAAFLAAISRPRRNFVTAVNKNDVSKALNILQNEASYQLLSSSTLNWALEVSCHYGNHLLASELVARGADVNWTGESGTPLWQSVTHHGSVEVVRLLLENGADVNHMGRAKITFTGDHISEAPEFAPRAALKKNDIKTLRSLLSFGADVHARYDLQYRPSALFPTHWSHRINLIHEAAWLGDVAAIELLLEYGADIDAVSRGHGTALMLALSKRRKHVAQFLLAKGANPNLKGASHRRCCRMEVPRTWEWFRSPIEAAVLSKSPSMTSLLLNRGVVPDDSTLIYAENLMSSIERKQKQTHELNGLKTVLKLLQDARKAREQ